MALPENINWLCLNRKNLNTDSSHLLSDPGAESRWSKFLSLAINNIRNCLILSRRKRNNSSKKYPFHAGTKFKCLLRIKCVVPKEEHNCLGAALGSCVLLRQWKLIELLMIIVLGTVFFTTAGGSTRPPFCLHICNIQRQH